MRISVVDDEERPSSVGRIGNAMTSLTSLGSTDSKGEVAERTPWVEIMHFLELQGE